jgi:ATP synthase F1 complex assembly factor 1
MALAHVADYRHGLNTVEELKETMKSEIEAKLKEFNKYDPLNLLEKTKSAVEDTAPGNNTVTPRGPYEEAAATAAKGGDIRELGSFVDPDKLILHSPKEIEMIWKARFGTRERAFCGTLNGVTFSELYRNASKYPTFVLPLPHKDQGVELHYVQWNFAGPFTLHCLITSLAEYKLHQEFARPHTTLIFHTNLLASKQIVLMNGSVEKDSPVLRDEAVLLALTLQRFYGASGSSPSSLRKLQLLENFNTGSKSFSVDDLVNETETVE